MLGKSWDLENVIPGKSDMFAGFYSDVISL